MTERKHKHLPTATVQDFLSLLAAVHLSSYVDYPHKDRGGMIVVGPPGAIKTTMLKFLDHAYPDALVLSDINVQGLVKIKERVVSNSVRSLVFLEMQKIYERHPQTAFNIEGHLRAFAGEGFTSASFEDQGFAKQTAYATLIGAMTNSLQEKYASHWQESGFARRFLWGLMSLENPRLLDEALINGNLLDISMQEAPRLPLNNIIPDYTDAGERRELLKWIKHQPAPHTAQLATLIKAWAVLKWNARQSRRSEDRAFQQLRAACNAFGPEGVQLVLE